jgi:hypothetical protein
MLLALELSIATAMVFKPILLVLQLFRGQRWLEWGGWHASRLGFPCCG